jgi:alanyl-tRNA synthetase
VEVSSADALKKLAFDLKPLLKDNYAVVLTAATEGKASVVVMVDEPMVEKGLDAGKIIKQHVAPLIKGGGGGQKTLATAGGQDASTLHGVIEAVKKLIPSA